MPIREVLAGIHTDTGLRDGLVDVAFEDGRLEAFFMSPATFLALMHGGVLGEVCDELEGRGPGSYPVPSWVVEREREFLVVGESDTCAMPTCWQDAVDRSRGYPLCQIHADQHADWDSLVG